ncbi:MAG: diguanylate cyclase [Fimbriimonadaceae bacterium]|nr:diguanylate cyclase [Fimbriimonadaceae bacterium]
MGEQFKTIATLARALRAIVVVLLGLLLSAPSGAQTVRDGRADLSGHDFARGPVVALDGEWRFVPGADSSTVDDLGGSIRPIRVPGLWGSHGVRFQPSIGRGTYLLQLRVPAGAGRLGLALPWINGAFELRANGVRIGGQGRVGDARTEIARSRPTVYALPESPTGRYEVRLAVSNHVHAEGGLRGSITLGRYESLSREAERQDIFGWVILGAALAITAHYLVTFAVSRDVGYGLFAGLAASLGLYLFVDRGLHYRVLPWMTEGPSLRVAYLLLAGIVPLTFGFLHRLFPNEVNTRTVRAVCLVAGCFVAVVVGTEPLLFTRLRDALIVFVVGSYGVAGWLTLRAWRHRRDGATLVVLTFLVALLAAFHEALLFFGAHQGPSMIGLALVVFSLGNAAALGDAVQRTQRAVLSLGEDLARLNATLEERIADRTHALAQSERRFRDVSEAVGEFIWETDARGVFVYLSGRVRDVLRYGPEDLLGRSLFSLMTEDVRAQSAGLMDANESPDGFRGAEIEALDRRGGVVVLQVSGIPIYEETGALAGWRGAALDVTERKRAEARLHELAQTDPLTGLANRRSFLDMVNEVIARCRREDRPAAMLLLDIDHFKRVNDTYGHEAGDAVIEAVAASLKRLLRDEDVVARYGGEEFALFLPNTAKATAYRIGERVRRSLAEETIEFGAEPLTITASIGLSAAEADDLDARRLLREADQALYAAKRGGRNQTVTYEIAVAVAGSDAA